MHAGPINSTNQSYTHPFNGNLIINFQPGTYFTINQLELKCKTYNNNMVLWIVLILYFRIDNLESRPFRKRISNIISDY